MPLNGEGSCCLWLDVRAGLTTHAGAAPILQMVRGELLMLAALERFMIMACLAAKAVGKSLSCC